MRYWLIAWKDRRLDIVRMIGKISIEEKNKNNWKIEAKNGWILWMEEKAFWRKKKVEKKTEK